MAGADPETDGHLFGGDHADESKSGITVDAEALRPSMSDSQELPYIVGYRIFDRLGSGGMGTVYKAHQLSTNRDVALKVMGKDISRALRSRALFTQEVRLAARLVHPNVVRIYDSGIDCGLYYYAMELIEGQTLDRYALGPRSSEPGEARQTLLLPRRKTLELMQQICRGVHEAHLRGVIHRDLKPRNIMVTPDGQPHVLDFGLATPALLERIDETPISADPPSPSSQRGPDEPDLEYHRGAASGWDFSGTPAFMSPEQGNGRPGDLDFRTDVYSLGVTLYLLLTGRMPRNVTGGDDTVIQKVMQEPIIAPCKADPTIDRELEAILLKSLAFDRRQRYASAAEMADDLGRYIDGRPLLAMPNSAPYVLRKWVGRHRRRVSIATGVAFAIGALAAYSWLSHRDLRNTQVESSEYDGALKQIISEFNPQIEGRQIGDRDRLNRFADSAASLFHDRPALRASKLDLIGVTLMDLGWCRDAEKWLQQARDLQSADDYNLESIRTINDLAAVKRELGQSANSATLSQHVLSIAKTVVGSESQSLRALMELAYALDDQGRPDEAFAAATNALDMSKAMHPADPRHPDILRAQNTLAIALRDQGKLDQASNLVNEVLEARKGEKTAGPTHPDTIRSMDLYATILGLTGHLDEAITEIDSAIKLSANSFGVDHSDRLRFENDRGTLLCRQGKFAEAAKCLKDALDKSNQQVGEEDLSTISLMGSLAATLCAWADQLQNDNLLPKERHDFRGQAEELLARVIQALNEPSGADDPALIKYKEALASVECEQGKYPEAQKLYEYILHVRETRSVEKDPVLVRSLSNLADVLRFQGKLQPAERLYYRIWQLQVDAQGAASPAAQAALNDLNRVREMQSEPPEPSRQPAGPDALH